MSERDSICASAEKLEVEYRDVPGYPGYRAGSDGSIWSCRITKTWHRLKPAPDRDGRLKLSMRRADGVIHGMKVHRVILLAFAGPCPEGMEACHYPDPSPQNNAIGNLRWDTKKANIEDSKKQGRMGRGFSKLTPDKVREIRKLLAARATHQDIADRFGVNRATITQIALNITWRGVS